jgi:hypothetical protein
MTPPRWLEWAREIQALAQTGFHYSENEYQRQRNKRLMGISAEIIDEHSNLEYPLIMEVFNTQIGFSR